MSRTYRLLHGLVVVALLLATIGRHSRHRPRQLKDHHCQSRSHSV